MASNTTTVQPSNNEFPYYLEVNDEHDKNDEPVQYPREGYARLVHHDPVTGDPETVEYIQEQPLPPNQPVDEDRIHAPVSPHQLPETPHQSWDSGPGGLWDFIETVRDEYYEHDIDASELPVRVVTHRQPDESPHEYCEIYFRNGENDTEYLMWNSDELYRQPETGELLLNSMLVQKVLVAFAQAYENPTEFLKTWGPGTRLSGDEQKYK